MATQQDYFNPQSLTIRMLFNDSNSLYQIPRYQRPYKWTDEEVDKLWSDLTEAYENETESYFLGSVITASPKDGGSYLDVVDGQQRITTLIILFAVIRDLFPSLNRAANTDPSVVTSKTIKNSIVADEEFNRLKLVTHVNHQTHFEDSIINADTKLIEKPKKKYVERDEEPLYKFLNTAYIFRQRMEEKGEEYTGKFINYLFNKVRVIRIDCTSKEFAIKLFQVLNDRGLDLTNADLIKSYLIEKIEREFKEDASLQTMKENQFMQEWISTEQVIKDFDDNLNDVFIIYEYHLLGSNPKKSLYDELVADFKDKKSLDIIKDFKKFVENYRTYLWDIDDSNIYAFWYLRWNYYWKSILLTAYHVEYPDTPKLIALLKRFYYIYWIAGKTLTAIKQTSFNLIGYVKDKKPYEEIEAIIQKKIDDDKIIDDTLRALNNDIYNEAWCKPLFCLLEYNATDKSRLTWIPIQSDVNIEHIIPKKHKNFKEWNHITDDMFKYWGNSGANLTLLSGSKNIEASANPFKDKINVYKGKGRYQDKNTKVTGYNITQSIVNDYEANKYNKEWNEDAIWDRWEWFCREVGEILKIDTSKLIASRELQMGNDMDGLTGGPETEIENGNEINGSEKPVSETTELSSNGENELIAAIKKNNKDKNWWNKYFDLIRDAMTEFKVDENSPKIAMTTTKSHKMPVSIGQRYIISSSIRSKTISMIFPVEFEEVLSDYPQAIVVFDFNNRKGEGEAILVRFTSDIIFADDSNLFEAWKDAIGDEMDRTTTSGFRKYHNPFYYKAVMDLGYREQLLNSIGVN